MQTNVYSVGFVRETTGWATKKSKLPGLRIATLYNDCNAMCTYMDVFKSLAGSSTESVVAIAGSMALAIPLSSTEMGECRKRGQTAARSSLGNVRSGHDKDIKHLEYCAA